MEFKDFGLSESLLAAVKSEGYILPTPIQELAIPHVLAGRDILGCAQTGTGKTAAFALPILHRLSCEVSANGRDRAIRVLVLTPTRELAAQIDTFFEAYGCNTHLRHAVVFGGVSQVPQEKAIRHGVDILTATPGRLLDLMGQGIVKLGEVEVLVLDEADKMLDMGFIIDVRRIIDEVPRERQTLLFSATLAKEIVRLGARILREPVELRVHPEAPAAETVAHHLYLVEKKDKRQLLEHLLRQPEFKRVLVFTNRKHNADRMSSDLAHSRIRVEVMHSDKSQGQRQRALENFRTGKTKVLVASDIAARGIDIDDITHVINYELPPDPETYVHRIGRTGRAGHEGTAVSFCSVEERVTLDSIERLIAKKLITVDAHPFESPLGRTEKPAEEPQKKMYSSRRPVGRGGGRRGRR